MTAQTNAATARRREWLPILGPKQIDCPHCGQLLFEEWAGVGGDCIRLACPQCATRLEFMGGTITEMK